MTNSPPAQVPPRHRLWVAGGIMVLAVLIGSSLVASPRGTLPAPATPTPTLLANALPSQPPFTAMPVKQSASAIASSPPAQALPIDTIILPTATPVPEQPATSQPISTSTLSPTAAATPSSTQAPPPGPSPTVVPTSTTPAMIAATLVRVIDGDTFDVSIDGKKSRVRIIGVDSPETNGKPICYGQEAKAKAKELLEAANGHLLLEKDVSETDRYGRLLRYIWLQDPSGLRMLDEEMVRQGYAQVSTFPPDVKYQQRFLAAQRDAQSEKRGL